MMKAKSVELPPVYERTVRQCERPTADNMQICPKTIAHIICLWAATSLCGNIYIYGIIQGLFLELRNFLERYLSKLFQSKHMCLTHISANSSEHFAHGSYEALAWLNCDVRMRKRFYRCPCNKKAIVLCSLLVKGTLGPYFLWCRLKAN